MDAGDGRLLDATDEMTGESVPYGIRKTDPDERERMKFSDAKKMVFQREEDRDKCPLLARFFGKFLCAAREIRVYDASSTDRRSTSFRFFPTACSYLFPPEERENTTIPAGFDYATCLLAVPIVLADASNEGRERAARVAREVARESRPESGHGHPGLTNDEEELAVLRRRSWNDVEEDVVATPYREGYANDWYPVLRDDGRAGLYFPSETVGCGASGSGLNAYVVVDNALPHFACDQLRILFSENPKSLSWSEWMPPSNDKKKTEILDRALELSGAVAEAIASRTIDALVSADLARKRDERDAAMGKTRVFVNRLVSVTVNKKTETRYDAAVLRGSQFHSESGRLPKGLFRVGDDGYAVVDKQGFQMKDDEVFPAFARDEKSMREITNSVMGYSRPIFLRRAKITD